MDINGDGHLDLVTGGFNSLTEIGNAPVYVMRGGEERLKFSISEYLKTVTDGFPLPMDEYPFCTKPCFADLNGDGLLDLIYGNRMGKFYCINGVKAEAGLSFSGTGKYLHYSDKSHVHIPAGYSSPHFVDWDADGDRDLLSGSKKGGVFYIENKGTANKPVWEKPEILLEPLSYSEKGGQLSPYLLAGKGSPTVPQYVTSVTTVDYNRDGKIDLVVGDHSTLHAELPNQELNTKDTGNIWIILKK